MDEHNPLRAFFLRFYWPPSAPLRRLATINMILWGILTVVGLSQRDTSSIVGLWYGIFLGTITWTLIRLCVYDAGGRLAPRLPFRWTRTKWGRSLFGFQALITLYLAQHDLVTWAVQPTLRIHQSITRSMSMGRGRIVSFHSPWNGSRSSRRPSISASVTAMPVGYVAVSR